MNTLAYFSECLCQWHLSRIEFSLSKRLRIIEILSPSGCIKRLNCSPQRLLSARGKNPKRRFASSLRDCKLQVGRGRALGLSSCAFSQHPWTPQQWRKQNFEIYEKPADNWASESQCSPLFIIPRSPPNVGQRSNCFKSKWKIRDRTEISSIHLAHHPRWVLFDDFS